ncbi:hypothetical protein AAC387_Pa01g2264 [Persea americana]
MLHLAIRSRLRQSWPLDQRADFHKALSMMKSMGFKEKGGLGKDLQGHLDFVVAEEKHDLGPSKEDWSVPWSSPPSSQTVFVKAASQLLQEAPPQETGDQGPSSLNALEKEAEEDWLSNGKKRIKYTLSPPFCLSHLRKKKRSGRERKRSSWQKNPSAP